jgi:hypothetical protein
MFDPQTLVLLAFARLENNDRKGVQHCQDDFIKLLERHGDNPRYRRLAAIVDALILILDRQFARSVDAVRDMAARVMEPSFDFESASNLLALMGQLANKAIQLDEVDRVVDTLGMRFCTSRSLAELLAGSAAVYPTYAERIRLRNAQVLKYAENAMTLSMGGNPTAAVKDLIAHGEETQNAKLVETAYLVLQRYAAKVEDLEQLTAVVQELRTRFGPASVRPTLGEPKREAGALRLRTGSRSVEPADEAVAGSTVE